MAPCNRAIVTTANPLASPRVVNIEDLRRLARRRLPRAAFDYLDGGAESELTLRENVRAFEEIVFRPRNAVKLAECNLGVKVLGQDLAMPAMLAPVGYSRLLHASGEVAAARAAGEFGTGYILSTISGYKLEEVRGATKGPAWFQLYLLGDRAASENTIERAHSAGFSALVITIDTAVAGMRERDHRNGMAPLLGASPLAKLPYVPDILLHPRWLAAFLADGGVPDLANVMIPGKGPMKLIDVGAALANAAVTWDDLQWIRKVWPGHIIVKGVLTADDAKRAVDSGAAALVVSNHGGRQLDSVSATIRALPEIVRAVDGRIEVLMDGGIRRGGDIVKAMCLGAQAVLIGRAYAYGLAAAGYDGVVRALQILRADLERTLRLLGCESIAALDHSYVETPRAWHEKGC